MIEVAVDYTVTILVLAILVVGAGTCVAGGLWLLVKFFDWILVGGNPRLPGRGAVAVCSQGIVGMIENDKPQRVHYPDGNTGKAWVGRAIWPPGVFGEKWSSRNPRVLCRIPKEML